MTRHPEIREGTITLTIDGREVNALPGQAIIDAARETGFDIPSLCYDGRMEHISSCRMCVVEVAGEADLVAACSAPVSDGMEIRTDTDEIRSVRKLILELLFSDHNAYCIPPCQNKCPAHLDIPGYVGAVAEGDAARSTRIIKERLPFPRVVGRVCPRPCEDVCRRAQNDEAVAICQIKRYAGDEASGGETLPYETAEPTGKRVAVVGAGPAGLANAYYLALMGHALTVFEALPEAGGELRYGIPEYRLPKQVLDEELQELWSLGIELKTNMVLGRDLTIDSLLEEGYDAVFLGIGAQAGRPLQIEGEIYDGVFPVVDFLRDVTLGQGPEMGRKVVVIGGGFSAMDAARMSLRMGAEEVTVLYRRTRAEMPAHENEVRDAEEEGVRIEFLVAPIAIRGEHGKVSSVVCRRMELGEPDESGRRRPVPVEGSDFEVKADLVISAIGQRPMLYYRDVQTGRDYSLFPADSGIRIHDYWKSIEADPVTGQTDRPQVFAAGDAVTGAATVIEAVAGARRAALAMDDFLAGRDLKKTRKNLTEEEPVYLDIRQLPEVEAPRQKMPVLNAEERARSHEEVELGFSDGAARLEAARCLQCVCEVEASCRLRQLGIEYEILENRFEGKMHPVPPLEEPNPVISRQYEKCIVCGACAGICDEVVGPQAIELNETGMDTHIACAYHRELASTECIFCGQCVSACPTGALDNRMSMGLRPLPQRPARKTPQPETIVPEPVRKTNTTCPYCGVGCTLTLHVADNRIIEVSSEASGSVNNGNLCVKGRYGFDFVSHPDRLTTPLRRIDGELVPCSWDEAIGEVSRQLARIRGEHGPDAVGFFASGRCTNEDDYLVQKLARAVIGTNNVDHCARL